MSEPQSNPVIDGLAQFLLIQCEHPSSDGRMRMVWIMKMYSFYRLMALPWKADLFRQNQIVSLFPTISCLGANSIMVGMHKHPEEFLHIQALLAFRPVRSLSALVKRRYYGRP